MENSTIFDLQQSRKDAEYIANNADLGLEVGADIIETVADVPYVGSLFKLGKAAKSYIDYRFFRKLGHYLKYANSLPEEKVAEFLDSISPKDKKRISDYLTQVLYSAEDDEKAEIMGKIYVRRVLGEIDNEMMLRLCSIINKCFIYDLKHLRDYKEVTDTNDYITDNLVALGVLADAGNMYEETDDGLDATGFGPTKHTLNEVGVTLCQIIEDNPVNVSHINRIEDHVDPSRPLSNQEMEELENLIR